MLEGAALEKEIDKFYAFQRSPAWVLIASYAHDTPEERRAKRRKQKVFLARYAYQNVLQWDDVPTPELDRLHHEAMRLVIEEGESVRDAARGH